VHESVLLKVGREAPEKSRAPHEPQNEIKISQ
jgi:hypothetical protein